jgi:gamma-glutamyl-gamma-aminobutyrate hydrolase PuuD
VVSNASEVPDGTEVFGSAERRPLIGLTTYLERARSGIWDTEFALLHANYVDAVSRAGGTAVLLPPQPSGAEELIEALDGLLVTGGADISPDRYGEAPHPETSGTRPGRDEWETRLLRRALDIGLPVLGICRGAQLLNVALGGTLRQHLPDDVGHEEHRPRLGVFGSTRLRLEPGSRIAGLLGAELKGGCHHHQAIGRVAAGLEVAGRSPDGTIEAVEMAGRFVLGVQWHPEQDDTDPRLFGAIVAAARDYAGGGYAGRETEATGRSGKWGS